MTKRSVLIIAEDPQFVRALRDRWQTERSVPAVTVATAAEWQLLETQPDLAVLAPAPLRRLLPLIEALERAGTATICLCDDAGSVQTLRDRGTRALVMRQHEDWPDMLVTLATEVLRRVDATARALTAEADAVAAQHEAALGRYFLDMRHSLNNALTSVLGNAELLLLDTDALSPEVHDQVETIHCMALRMHESIQRLSSLDAELQFTAKRSQPEKNLRAPARALAR